MLDAQSISAAAGLLAKAHESRESLVGFPEACRPTTFEDGYAIQDAVAAAASASVGGYKAIAPKAGDLTHGPMYAHMVRATPAEFSAAVVRPCGVEGEVAFRARIDLPARATSYTRDEVAAAMDACAAIEVVSSRFADYSKMTVFERLADNNFNGGFVYADAVSDWRDLDLGNLHVVLEVNGTVVDEHNGGHLTGDPLGVAVALVNMLCAGAGIRAGQYLTCGSYTGVKFLKPNDVCTVRFDGLGEAQVGIVP